MTERECPSFYCPFPQLSDDIELYAIHDAVTGMDFDVYHSPPFTTSDQYHSFSSEIVDFLAHESMPIGHDLEDQLELNNLSGGVIDEISKWLMDGDDDEESCLITEQVFILLPTQTLEIKNDHQLRIHHLAKAYGEVVEKKQEELAKVIRERLSEKLSPIGEVRERLLYYYFCHSLDMEAEYLRHESFKNIGRALDVFYRVFPYGMVAHFTANSAILEAMPQDAEVLHLVDFDIGEGIQWCSMIMALAQQQQLQQKPMTLKITAIKWKEEEGLFTSWRSFEETKTRLEHYAIDFGLILKVEQTELQDLVSEIKRGRKRGENYTEVLAFNCMWALPHMGRMRSRRHVLEFLMLAKEHVNNVGILTFGHGAGWEIASQNCCSGFGVFFERYMEHYEALLESMDLDFPINNSLGEARVAMEWLFVAPYVSSVAGMQNWEEMNECTWDFKRGFGFEGYRVSNESVLEAKEMAREGERPYKIRIEGEASNEMILEWKGTPLLRISTWR